MIEDPKFTVYGSQIQEWMEDIQKLKQERNELREKCDKLNNNMIELRKKAEAFDEMVKIYNQKNDLPSDEIYIKMGYCISDLERGSDEYSRN